MYDRENSANVYTKDANGLTTRLFVISLIFLKNLFLK